MALVKVPYEIRGKQYAGRQFEGVIVYVHTTRASESTLVVLI